MDRDEVTGNALLKMRQEMPLEAYLTPEEAAALLDRDDRSALGVSHGWQCAAHPDPHGKTLRALLQYLRSNPAAAACERVSNRGGSGLFPVRSGRGLEKPVPD